MLLLFLILTTFAVSHQNHLCPSECECEHSNLDFKESITINCNRGKLNDSSFALILEKLPLRVNILEIRAPKNQPNYFEWNDNLNRLQRLERLSLINCQIPAISQSVRLSNLKFLNLEGNRIDHLYMTTFSGLANLEHLDLSNNRLSNLPSGAFSMLKKLKSLNLSHNNLVDLASNLLFGPKSLQILQLDGNHLQADQINELFGDISQLQRLELNHLGLGDFGAAQLKFTQIENLKRLGLAGNNLTYVPSRMLKTLPGLEVIDLSHNQIRSLESCAFCSCNITSVLMSHNLLGIEETAISSEAFFETTISMIDLSFNYFDEFDAVVLGKAQETVKILDLSGNNIGGFHHRLTHTLNSLTHLHMAANGIKEIPANLPYEYTRFVFLNLSKNILRELPDDIGSLLPSLKVLDVSHNHLTIFSTTVISSFINSLDLFYIHHNPLDCRCVTHMLQQFMLQRNIYATELKYSETVCASPPLVSGRPLHRVQHINDCAILFGASYGLTQSSELMVLLIAVLVAAVIVALFVLALMGCSKRQKYKGTYFTREPSKQKLTLPMLDTNMPFISPNSGNCPSSTVTSALSEPLSPTVSDSHHSQLPPPPPGSMFVTF